MTFILDNENNKFEEGNQSQIEEKEFAEDIEQINKEFSEIEESKEEEIKEEILKKGDKRPKDINQNSSVEENNESSFRRKKSDISNLSGNKEISYQNEKNNNQTEDKMQNEYYKIPSQSSKYENIPLKKLKKKIYQ